MIQERNSRPAVTAARRELMARRKDLLSDLDDDKARLSDPLRLGPSRTLGGGMDDEVYAQNRDLLLAIGEQHFNELVEIDRALAAIDDGTWGQCVQCGKLIEADRLLIHPVATHCIHCQQAREISQSGKDPTPSL